MVLSFGRILLVLHQNICSAMMEAIKHTYILEEYQGFGGPDQGVLDMKGVKVMLATLMVVNIMVMMMTIDHDIMMIIIEGRSL